jgi:hypothetical protein
MDKALETLLARYCAPVLLGKKPAALFASPPWWEEKLRAPGVRRDLRFLRLSRPGKNALVFAYKPELLAGALADPLARKVLADRGYPAAADTEANLAGLARRFRESREFPHEIGIFLGYPPPDVLGFIRHRGAHCKLCGVWKVYSDVERAAALFEEYARCKQRLLEYLQTGGGISDENLPAILLSPT